MAGSFFTQKIRSPYLLTIIKTGFVNENGNKIIFNDNNYCNSLNQNDSRTKPNKDKHD